MGKTGCSVFWAIKQKFGEGEFYTIPETEITIRCTLFRRWGGSSAITVYKDGEKQRALSLDILPLEAGPALLARVKACREIKEVIKFFSDSAQGEQRSRFYKIAELITDSYQEQRLLQRESVVVPGPIRT